MTPNSGGLPVQPVFSGWCPRVSRPDFLFEVRCLCLLPACCLPGPSSQALGALPICFKCLNVQPPVLVCCVALTGALLVLLALPVPPVQYKFMESEDTSVPSDI